MEWVEVELCTVSSGVDEVSTLLMDNGIDGFQIKDDYEFRLFLENNRDNWDYADEELMNKEAGEATIVFYVRADEEGISLYNTVKNALVDFRNSEVYDSEVYGSLELLTKNVDDSDWLDSWKKHYKPFRLGEKIIIKPAWEEYSPNQGDVVVEVNPGRVFGTGQHESTQLCIVELEKFLREGDEVIDIGCGSGILSIISMKLGANSVFGLDIEKEAVQIAYDNAEMNGINKENFEIVTGNLLSEPRMREKAKAKKYNVVLANIVADIVIAHTPFVKEIIANDGYYITSGIIRERADDVAEILANNGFEIVDRIRRDEWVCIVARYLEK